MGADCLGDASGDSGRDVMVARSTDGVSNWMHMFRWIVKLIRDEHGIDEKILTRQAILEQDCGLTLEQVEDVMDTISESFGIAFPPNTLDEVVKLEELCMLAAWMTGLYKQPAFLSDAFAGEVRALNPSAGA